MNATNDTRYLLPFALLLLVTSAVLIPSAAEACDDEPYAYLAALVLSRDIDGKNSVEVQSFVTDGQPLYIHLRMENPELVDWGGTARTLRMVSSDGEVVLERNFDVDGRRAVDFTFSKNLVPSMAGQWRVEVVDEYGWVEDSRTIELYSAGELSAFTDEP